MQFLNPHGACYHMNGDATARQKKIFRAAARFSCKEQHAKVRVLLQRKPHFSCYCRCRHTSVPENLDAVPYIYISLISMWSHVMIVTQEMNPRAVRCSCPLQDCNISVASIWRIWCLICRVVFKPCTWMPLGVLDLGASMKNDERRMHDWTRMDDGWRRTEDRWGYRIRMGMMMRMDQDGWCMKCRCIDVWMCHVGPSRESCECPEVSFTELKSLQALRHLEGLALQSFEFRCVASPLCRAETLALLSGQKSLDSSHGTTVAGPMIFLWHRNLNISVQKKKDTRISVQRRKMTPVFLSTVF